MLFDRILKIWSSLNVNQICQFKYCSHPFYQPLAARSWGGSGSLPSWGVCLPTPGLHYSIRTWFIIIWIFDLLLNLWGWDNVKDCQNFIIFQNFRIFLVFKIFQISRIFFRLSKYFRFLDFQKVQIFRNFLDFQYFISLSEIFSFD